MVQVRLIHCDDVSPIVPFIQGYHNVEWSLAIPTQIKGAGIREIVGVVFNALSGVEYGQDCRLRSFPLG